MLYEYLQMVQRFIHDQKQEAVSPSTLVTYVNRARREIAMRTQCLRILPPITGQVIGGSVTAAGSGYTAPTITISAPDFPSGMLPSPNGLQATATATIASGSITGVNMTEGGQGYFQPTVTVTDATGTGAAIAAILSPMMLLQQGREEYKFSDIDLSMFPGVGSPYAIIGMSVLYSNWRYSLSKYSWSVYQARVRQFSQLYQYIPTVFSQRGQGADASLFCYPVPSQNLQAELDLFCLPQDLTTDEDDEALPAPWTEAVPWYAAFLCYTELQNLNSARSMLELFDRHVTRYSTAARPGRQINPYGRFLWPLVLWASSALAASGVV